MQSTGSATTEQIGEQIGRNLKGGEVIELSSDLGGGKTTFVRGLARGAGSHSHVSSPTFKISNVYDAPKFEIVHYDFYRLNEPGLIKYELTENMHDPKAVIVIEWADIVHEVLPQDKLKIHIQSVSETKRVISITSPASLNYMVDGVRV